MGICGPRAVGLLCCREDFTNYLPKLQSSTPALLQRERLVGRGGGGKKRGRAVEERVKGKREKEREQEMHFKVSLAIGWGGAGPNVKS